MLRNINLLIILRKKHNFNLFRNIILNSLASSVGDEALLCSGFFQELRGSPPYQASKDLGNSLSKSKVILTTVGIHNKGWLKEYQIFVKNLKKIIGNRVLPMHCSDFRWHAKIFILSIKDENILGIIGSSNITRPAFDITQPYNKECDIILWNNAISKLNEIIEQSMKEYEPEELIQSFYDEEINKLSINDRLKKLKDEISKKIIPLEEL